jgi:hypothetical protein
MKEPAIPALVLIPDGSHEDYRTLYAIATAYAHSGLMISEYADKTDRMEFAFPAIVCSSFAIELFMKFFIKLSNAKKDVEAVESTHGHGLLHLWNKIEVDHQKLIAGMFRNKTGVPVLNAAERRIELFVEVLADIGNSPFIKWRYAHEETKPVMMSHAQIVLVLDAFGYASEYTMKQNRVVA